MSPGHRLESISLEELFTDESILSEWRRLAMELPGASYFQTPDWGSSWWETIGMRATGWAALVWEQNRLAGLFALADVKEKLSGRLPLRIPIATNAGSGIGTDHAGWLASAGAEALLKEWTMDHAPVLLKGVPLHIGEMLGGRLTEVQRCPRLDLDKARDSISTKLAKNLRNAQKRLAKDDVEFAWSPSGTVGISDLERLYSLHRMRRSETGDESIFEEKVRRDFHERLLEKADPQGGTSLMVARREGEVVGILYGFTWQRTFEYYQIGWDPRFRQMSLGSVLVLEAIEACSSMGMEMFDFLRGADDYKYRFGAVDVVEGTFLLGRGARVATLSAMSRLRQSSQATEAASE